MNSQFTFHCAVSSNIVPRTFFHHTEGIIRYVTSGSNVCKWPNISAPPSSLIAYTSSSGTHLRWIALESVTLFGLLWPDESGGDELSLSWLNISYYRIDPSLSSITSPVLAGAFRSFTYLRIFWSPGLQRNGTIRYCQSFVPTSTLRFHQLHTPDQAPTEASSTSWALHVTLYSTPSSRRTQGTLYSPFFMSSSDAQSPDGSFLAIKSKTKLVCLQYSVERFSRCCNERS